MISIYTKKEFSLLCIFLILHKLGDMKAISCGSPYSEYAKMRNNLRNLKDCETCDINLCLMRSTVKYLR